MEENDDIRNIENEIAGLNIELSKTLAQNERISQIEYYKDMQLIPEEMSEYNFEEDIFIVQKEISNKKGEKSVVYELYDEEKHNIGTVVEGKVHFNPQYLDFIKEACKDDISLYEELVALDGKIEFKELLERNKEKGLTMTEKEIDEHIKEEKSKEDNSKEEKGIDEEEKEEDIEDDKEDEEKDKDEQEIDKENKDDSLKEKIAEEKGIPTHSIIFVKENSNLYRNHPELERNMFFYRDNDGIVRAEFINKDGKPEPSAYINNSTTRTHSVVDIGKDGSEVQREVPYQFMTSSIDSKPAGVKEIGFSVDIEMGYLEIKESWLGTNGQWASHEVEMQGRDYNSHEVNELTKTNKSINPNRITNTYNRMENTGFAENGLEMDELSIRKNVERFMEEGYQKAEAIDIVNYMVGYDGEPLSEEAAKEKVNEEIKERAKKQREAQNKKSEYEKSSKQENTLEEEEYEGRVPWDGLGYRRV